MTNAVNQMTTCHHDQGFYFRNICNFYTQMLSLANHDILWHFATRTYLSWSFNASDSTQLNASFG